MQAQYQTKYFGKADLKVSNQKTLFIANAIPRFTERFTERKLT